MINIDELLLDTFTTSSGEVLVRVPFGYFKEIEGWTEEQFLEAYKPQQWDSIREQRNKLLLETDWTQNRDVMLSNNGEWLEYRQSLRDITSQSDPYNIIWPEKP